MSTSLGRFNSTETERIVAYIHSEVENYRSGFYMDAATRFYWNLRPIEVSGLWELILGEDWYYDWDNPAMSEFLPLFKRFVAALDRAYDEWGDIPMEIQIEMEYTFSLPEFAAQLPWGRYVTAVDDEMWRFRGGGKHVPGVKSVGGFVRTVMIVPVQVKEQSWIVSAKTTKPQTSLPNR